jgi:hypothetical protein
MYLPIDQINHLTHIISLGPDCQATFNLRRYFSIEKAYPFDWWINPADGLIKALKNPNDDYLFNPDNLILTRDDDFIINNEIGISYHHDFSRTSEMNRIDLNFKDQIENVKNKYAHVINNFLNLNSDLNSILFIRSDLSASFESEILDLLESLFSKATYSLIFVEKPFNESSEWTGSISGWDSLFEKFDLKNKFFKS